MFVIVDIETTGGNSKTDKITDICIIVHDGLSVVETFSTLINPEKYITPYITRLTGITNEMVKDAPKFYEVAKRIVEITEGKIFVAHNVEFDYGFIRQEFKSLGYNYEREKLCTIKLSRKLLPGLHSYSLGNLCSRLGIHNKARHRAEGDAMATAELFNLLLAEKNKNKFYSKHGIEEINTTRIDRVKENIIKQLPEETGVYYFLDQNNQIIYIGKSRNIRSRGLSHLTVRSVKNKKMVNRLHDVDYVLTGSELLSLILEDIEIKKILPEFNRVGKIPAFTHHLVFYYEKKIVALEITDNPKTEHTVIKSFGNYFSAREYLNQVTEEFRLCLRYTGIDDNNGPCFNYQIKKCHGVCHGEEPIKEYNKRVQNILRCHQYSMDNFLIIEEGRHKEEVCIFKIKEQQFYGYQFFETTDLPNQPEEVFDEIKKTERTAETDNIIRTYINKTRDINIIALNPSITTIES